MRAMKVCLFCLSLLLGVSHAQVPDISGVYGATGVAGMLNAQLTGAAITGAPKEQAPQALAPELTTLGSLAIAQALSSSSPAEEAADAEVMCQTVKEALLALKTVTPSQLLMQADYAPQTGRKLLAGRALQQKEASACPGELSELQYGNCLNYFFTPDCHQAHEGVVNNLFGRGSPITTKTLKDVRNVVLHIFKDSEVCQHGGAILGMTTLDKTCAAGMEALKPVNYAQFMANAIAKIRQQPSPTQVGVNKQVSELAKAFTHLSSDADTVEVGESPSPPPPEPPAVEATGSLPIFIGLVFLALGGIGAALFFLRHKEMMQHLKGMESATAAYTAMMSKATEASKAAFEASKAAFGAMSGDGMSKRASKKPREQLTESGVATTVPSNKPRAPTLQEKLNMLREANSAAGIKKNQK